MSNKLSPGTYYSNHKSDVIEYQTSNKDKIKIYKKKYYLENKDKYKSRYYDDINAQREYHRQYRLEKQSERNEYSKKYNRTHRDNINIRHNNRKITDINYKLTCTLRSRLYCAIRNTQKVGSAVEDLGCSIKELKQYLENKFKNGMTWNNYGDWHIDHIIPLSIFDLKSRNDFLKACHYTNLQPLWGKENISKGNRILNGGPTGN